MEFIDLVGKTIERVSGEDDMPTIYFTDGTTVIVSGSYDGGVFVEKTEQNNS